MRPSPRRFRDLIVRKRTGADIVNEFGEVEPGPPTMIELRASLQPLSREDLDLIGGDRLIERITAYVPGEDSLLAIRDGGPADKVVIDGRGDFVVERSVSWFGSHTRAVILRED